MSILDGLDDTPQTRTVTDTDRAVDDILEPEIAQLPAVVSSNPAGSPEFQMLVVMAAGRKRDHAMLIKAATRIGERLGPDAIYSFPVGGKRAEGATVHLIEALAQEWGHLLYGARIELVDGDRVTLMGIVVDAITGTVAARPSMFTLPAASGKFDKNDEQRARWESMQVQNAISKATRGVLEHALPRWYVNAGKAAAYRVIRGNLGLKEGESFDSAVTTLVEWAATPPDAPVEKPGVGIPLAGLEAFVGVPRALWTISDLHALREALRGVKRGTVSREAFAVKGAPAPAPHNVTEQLKKAGESKKPKPEEPAPSEPGAADPLADVKPIVAAWIREFAAAENTDPATVVTFLDKADRPANMIANRADSLAITVKAMSAGGSLRERWTAWKAGV